MLDDFTHGAFNTVLLVLNAWLFGLPLGVALSFVSLRFTKYSIYLTTASVIFTVIPLLAILFWFHYPLQNLLNVVWSPYFTSTFLLSLFIALVSGEILSEEMRKIRRAYIDTSDVLGIPHNTFIRKVVFPAARKNAIPRLLNLAIASIHMTMFASLIGVEELFRVTMKINSEYLQPVKIFSIMALIYAAMCLPLYYFAHVLDKKLTKNSQDD